MKRYGKAVLMAVLVIGSAVYLASCDGAGDTSSPAKSNNNNTGNTTTSAQQGAQSAAASVNTARNAASVATTGTLLSGMVGVNAPALKAFASKSGATALNKFAARFSPAVRKARAMRAVGDGFTMTAGCGTQDLIEVAQGTPNSMTITTDPSGSMTMIFMQCREGLEMTDGTMVFSGSEASGSFTIGTDSAPFTVTTYASATSNTVEGVSKAAVTMASSTTGSLSSPTTTMTIMGWFEETDHVLKTRSKQVMSNLSMVGTTGAATIGGVAYEVATLTMNGSMTDTTYVSDTDPAVDYSETASFTNVTVAYKSPKTFGASNYYYLSMSGTFILDTTPDDKCVEGTLSVVTDTDVKIDTETGNTVAGKMTINTNTVVTFKADGSVDVSVNGGAAENFTQTQLDDLCDL